MAGKIEEIRNLLSVPDYAAALIRLTPLLDSYPKLGVLWAFRSQVALRRGEYANARRFAQRGIEVDSACEAHAALAEACQEGGDPARALAEYEFMAGRVANNPALARRAADAAFSTGQWEKALYWLAETARLNPLDSTPWINRGFVLKTVGRLDEALAAYDEGMARDPENADLRWNRAILLLTLGRWEEGLRDSEWRWKKRDFPSKPRGFPQPLWMGERTGTLLIHAEQGFGDCLQMLRYVPLAAERTEQVVLEIQPELLRLMQAQKSEGRLFPANLQLLAKGKQALPVFDAHVPMMTLPLSLGLYDLSRPPTCEAYLQCPSGIEFNDADAAVPPLNVGVAWRGRPTFVHNRLRSFDLKDLAPLFAIPGIRWLSLQKTPGADIAAELKEAPVKVIDLGARSQDFFDTASYLKSLDLLITTDTSVAHLAGALGVEAWVAVMTGPDWRWGLEGEWSPWYTSLRLFRQQTRGDWSSVFSAMAPLLSTLVKRG